MNAFVRWTMTCLLVGLFSYQAGRPRGEDAPSPTEQKSADQRLYDALRDVINQGADLYNTGDQNGCYRLYQGALMALRPQLDRFPELQKSVGKGLADADQHFRVGQRAFVLRDLLDKIRSRIKPNGSKNAGSPPIDGPKKATGDPLPKAAPTLWDRLGGEKNVRKVVDDFVELAGSDPKVNFTRNGRYKLDEAAQTRLKKQLMDLVSQITRGPYTYTGKSMKEAHAGMGITDAEFDASAADLKKALEKNGAAAADVDQVLQAVAATRKDIVQPKK